MTLKTILTLCRFSNLPTVWMNVLTAALLVDHFTSAQPNVLGVSTVAVAISLFYCGGMALNDYCDRHWDAQHQPFRPIPSGTISAAAVARISLSLLGAGLLLLLLAPHSGGFWAGVGLLATIIGYDYLHKAHPASVLLMALSRLWVFVVTALALSPEWTHMVFVAGALQFIYTLLVTVVARREHSRGKPYGFPLIPRMIAGMAMLDGLLLGLLVAPWWFLVGLGGFVLTRLGQRYVRGD